MFQCLLLVPVIGWREESLGRLVRDGEVSHGVLAGRVMVHGRLHPLRPLGQVDSIVLL